MRIRPVVVLLLGLAVLTGCSDGDDPPDLDGTSWTLLEDSLDMAVPDEVGPMDARFEEGRIAGSSGCNQYGATYTGDGGDLDIDEVGSTLIGCPPAVAEVETAFLERLHAVTGYRFEGDKLVLVDDDGDELLRFAPD